MASSDLQRIVANKDVGDIFNYPFHPSNIVPNPGDFLNSSSPSRMTGPLGELWFGPCW